MKSTGNGLSLSLRMRMEGESSMNLSSKSELSNFPKLPVTIWPPKNKTQAAADNTVKNKNFAARLSGTMSYTTGQTGMTVDRTQTIRPSICCVRCSFHASICMDCCDLQTKNAIAFYRRTLGRGASDILSRAIMEVGLGSMSKLIVFSLWKNGSSLRNQLREKRTVEVGRQYDARMMKRPLIAWKKFTKDEILSRKCINITDLELKCRALEIKMEKLTKAKEKTDSEMDGMNDRLYRSVAINDDYVETIRALRGELVDEKKRVVSLAALCGHVRNLSTVLNAYGQDEFNGFVSTLVDSGCNIPTYDYNRIYNNTSKDLIRNLCALREERKEKPSTKTRFLFKLESDATSKMLLQWANYISRDCICALSQSNIEGNKENEDDEDDDSFDSNLPRHEQAYDVGQLSTGKIISRIIFYLIHAGNPISKGNSTEHSRDNPKESSSENVLPAVSSPSRRRGSMDAKGSIAIHPLTLISQKKVNSAGYTKEFILSLKEAENDPKLLLQLSVKYASEFLSLPLYNFQDILDGMKAETLAFLGNLFISCPPTRDERNLDVTRSLLLEHDDLLGHIQDLHGRLGYSTRNITEIKEAFKEYKIPVERRNPNTSSRGNQNRRGRGLLMIEKEKRDKRNEDSNSKDVKPSSDIINNDENGESENERKINENEIDDDKTKEKNTARNISDANLDFDEKNQNSGFSSDSSDSSDDDNDDDNEVTRNEPDPSVLHGIESIKYCKLQKSIDKLVFSNELKLLEDSITAMTDNVKRLATMRNGILHAQKRKFEGIRLATDVRTFVSRNVLQNLVTPLGMAKLET